MELLIFVGGLAAAQIILWYWAKAMWAFAQWKVKRNARKVQKA